MIDVPKIAIAGKLKSGKTTLADELAEQLTLRRISFAAPLKLGLEVMGITKDHPLYRWAAQTLGEGARERMGPDFWVEQFDKRYRLYRSPHEILGYVIDDVRFENELAWAEANGFLTVRIHVSPETQIARGATVEQLDRPSEVGLDHLPDSRYELLIPEATTVAERVTLVRQALKVKTLAPARV